MNLIYDNNLTIFSVFHKAFEIPPASFIKPIQVGFEPDLPSITLRDNSGTDQIAEKNSRFCETTALYWIWKNVDKINSKYIGLAHYRRYLTRPEKIVVKKNFLSKKVEDSPIDIYVKPLNNESIAEICEESFKTLLLDKLNEADIILPKTNPMGSHETYDFGIKDHFIYHHLKEDWLIFEQALEKHAPNYAAFSKDFFKTKNSMHCFGMFVSNKDFLVNYCEWLFPILFELELHIKPSPYLYQNRAIGFLSERLLNLYVYKNQLKVHELPIVYFT